MAHIETNEVAPQPWIELLPYQKAAVETGARFTWNCWSRQTGKSFTFSLRRLLRGLLRRRSQIILSAGERQSREVMQKVRMHCQAMRIHATMSGFDLLHGASFRTLEATLPGGVRVIALPANPMTARGFTGDVFLDEFAMHRDDGAIWAALFPTLLRGEGELDVASTPRGKQNMFYRLKQNARFAQSVVALADAVAQGLDADLAEVREGVGDEFAWRQEFCCEFLDDAYAFMPLDLIHKCASPDASIDIDWTVLRERHANVFVGVDVGRMRDLTAIWLWRRNADGSFVTVGVRTLEGAPFDEQEGAITEILSQRGVRRCCIDASGLGMHLAERLVERYGDHGVVPVSFTAAVKNRMATGLRVMAEQGRLKIPADQTIANDWHAVTRHIGASGAVRYDADRSRGGHADRFWAAALGLMVADGCQTDDATYVTGESLRFGGQGVW